jgi:hypothetical protein
VVDHLLANMRAGAAQPDSSAPQSRLETHRSVTPLKLDSHAPDRAARKLLEVLSSSWHMLNVILMNKFQTDSVFAAIQGSKGEAHVRP